MMKTPKGLGRVGPESPFICLQRDEPLAILFDLFRNPAFDVAIGGNPIAVDELMDRVRAALAKVRGEQK